MEHKLLITKDKSNTIYSYNFDDIYHSKHGSINEAYHVFIKNGLLSDSRNKKEILEIGFGSGLNAMLTLIEAEKKLMKVTSSDLEIMR